MDLNTTWFILVCVLFTGYAMLDGFDLGVGALHLFTKKDEHRRIALNAIGPVWDGNEVWLVTGGGALFAAFPNVYASVFSGFYIAFILLLFSLIFRAVSIDFRSKLPMRWWRRTWDVCFSLGSIVASLLIGVGMGNIARGIPLDESGNFACGFLDLLNPYSLVLGVTTVCLFMMHGAIYLHMKTEGEMQAQVKKWINPCIIAFVICYVIFTYMTLANIPHMTARLNEYPWLYAIAVFAVLAIANVPREVSKNRDSRAFLFSCLTMVFLMALFAIGMFPYMVYSNPVPEMSLDIYNGSSSQKTLSIMFTIALIGMPVVLAYTISIYWIFRGKVKLNHMSY